MRFTFTDLFVHSRCTVCGVEIKRDVQTNGSRWEAEEPGEWGRFTCPEQPAGYVKGGRRGHQAGAEYWV